MWDIPRGYPSMERFPSAQELSQAVPAVTVVAVVPEHVPLKEAPKKGWHRSCRMGPPVDSVQLVYKWLNSMVYGRYNYS